MTRGRSEQKHLAKSFLQVGGQRGVGVGGGGAGGAGGGISMGTRLQNPVFGYLWPSLSLPKRTSKSGQVSGTSLAALRASDGRRAQAVIKAFNWFVTCFPAWFC